MRVPLAVPTHEGAIRHPGSPSSADHLVETTRHNQGGHLALVILQRCEKVLFRDLAEVSPLFI